MRHEPNASGLLLARALPSAASVPIAGRAGASGPVVPVEASDRDAVQQTGDRFAGARAVGGSGLRGESAGRDPALEGFSIEVFSDDPAHRAEQVGAAANRGLSLLSLPRPRPFFAPPAHRTRTLVGIDTWFWVSLASWRPVVRVVPASGVVVTLVATPVALQFFPGDRSAPVTCPGPGTRWWAPRSRSLCSHVFERSSGRGRFRGKVQTLWLVRWASNTGLGGTVGPIPVSMLVSLRVVEAQPVLFH